MFFSVSRWMELLIPDLILLETLLPTWGEVKKVGA
jgi:hypothetical protein